MTELSSWILTKLLLWVDRSNCLLSWVDHRGKHVINSRAKTHKVCLSITTVMKIIYLSFVFIWCGCYWPIGGCGCLKELLPFFFFVYDFSVYWKINYGKPKWVLDLILLHINQQFKLNNSHKNICRCHDFFIFYF